MEEQYEYDVRPDDRVDPYWTPDEFDAMIDNMFEEEEVPDQTIADVLVQSVSHVEFENRCKIWNLPYVIQKQEDKWIGIAQIEDQYLEVYFMY